MKTAVVLPARGIGLEVVNATCEHLVGMDLPIKILTPPEGRPPARGDQARGPLG